MTESSGARRAVQARQIQIFHQISRKLISIGLRPNQVSVLSSVFALAGAVAIIMASRAQTAECVWLFLVLGVLGIQLRLICNLIDGLMAVEGGFRSVVGEIYNEVPDRISDSLLFVAAGFCVPGWGLTLGLSAALLSMFTAYIRVLGCSQGTPAYFSGPMAKQHRMFLLSVGLMGSGIEYQIQGTFGQVLLWVLIVIGAGSLITAIRRLRQVMQSLRSR